MAHSMLSSGPGLLPFSLSQPSAPRPTTTDPESEVRCWKALGPVCGELSFPPVRWSISPVPPNHAPYDQKEEEQNDGKSQHDEKPFLFVKYAPIKLLENGKSFGRIWSWMSIRLRHRYRWQPLSTYDTKEWPLMIISDGSAPSLSKIWGKRAHGIWNSTRHCYRTHPLRDPRIIFSLEV